MWLITKLLCLVDLLVLVLNNVQFQVLLEQISSLGPRLGPRLGICSNKTWIGIFDYYI